MAITKIFQAPTKLPHAALYLEDVEEISKILFEAYTPNDLTRESLTYLLPDCWMDSIEDLERHGGSTSRFTITYGFGIELRINSFLPPELRLYSLPENERWAVFGRVKAICESRQYRLKNAVSALPRWLKILLYLMLVGFPSLVMVLSAHRAKLTIVLVVAYCIVLGVVAFEQFRPSRVCLFRHRDKSKRFSKQRRKVTQQLIVLVVVAILSAILGHYVPLFWK